MIMKIDSHWNLDYLKRQYRHCPYFLRISDTDPQRPEGHLRQLASSIQQMRIHHHLYLNSLLVHANFLLLDCLVPLRIHQSRNRRHCSYQSRPVLDFRISRICYTSPYLLLVCRHLDILLLVEYWRLGCCPFEAFGLLWPCLTSLGFGIVSAWSRRMLSIRLKDQVIIMQFIIYSYPSLYPEGPLGNRERQLIGPRWCQKPPNLYCDHWP